ncbi:MAG: FkbM family methyltransferase [Syntrophomonadaceae bacterium]
MSAPSPGSRGLSRFLYYFASIFTILRGMRPRGDVVRLFLGLPVPLPLEIRLPDGLRFRVRTRMEAWLLKETCLDGDYEREAPLEDGWTIVDVGAANGDFAVHAAARDPKGVVHAFEPLPEAFARLEEHVRLNGVTNVRAERLAVAAAEGHLALYTVTGLPGQHRTAGDGSAAEGPAVAVRATTLSRVFERHGIAQCDLLKLDCEGAEFDILLGLPSEVLARIARIVLEYHDHVTPHTHQELAGRLRERGFRVRTRSNPAWKELGFLYAENVALTDARSPLPPGEGKG